MPVRGFPGAPKPTEEDVLSTLREPAACLAGWCSGGETVAGDVGAGRFEVFGSCRTGGFFGFGSFGSEGLFEVVSDGQGESADGVSGETERAAPSGYEAALCL